MPENLSKHEKNLSAIIHASTFSRYIFPFGNFIVPLVLWMANKERFQFVDYNGKQALNFQISMLLYSLLIGVLSLPFFFGVLPNILDIEHFDIFNFNNNFINFNLDNFNFRKIIWPVGITGLLQAAVVIVNVVYTIIATLKTNEGQHFKYPLTINFIK